jgi:hypothetical protein
VLLPVEPPPCPLVFGGLVVGIMFVYRTVKVKHLKRNEEFKTPAPAYIYIEEPLYLPHSDALFLSQLSKYFKSVVQCKDKYGTKKTVIKRKLLLE